MTAGPSAHGDVEMRQRLPPARCRSPLLEATGRFDGRAPGGGVGDERGGRDRAVAGTVGFGTFGRSRRIGTGGAIVGLTRTSRRSVDDVRRSVDDLAEVTEPVRGIDAVGVTVDAADAEGVARRIQDTPGVTYVEPEHEYRAFGSVTPNDEWFQLQTESLQVRLPQAWATTKGSSDTIVAVLDSGVTPNNDLVNADGSSAVLPGYDFVNNDADPADDDGHGTVVATVLAGRGDNSFGIAGVCWRCRVLPVKVLDSAGLGTTSQIAAGITYAVDHGARIPESLLGGPSSSSALDAAAQYALSRGVIVVGSAGNEGNDHGVPGLHSTAVPGGIAGRAGRRVRHHRVHRCLSGGIAGSMGRCRRRIRS